MLNDHGVINFALSAVGLPPVDWFGLQSGSGAWIKPAIALVTVWQYFGWNVILFSAGLQAIPNELYEAARIDGARSLDVLLHITLPLLKRVTFFIVSITIIGSIQLFDIPLMLLGGLGGTGQGTLGGAEAGGLTIAMLIYDTAFSYGQFGYAGSMALTLFAILIALTFLNRYLFFREREA